MSPLGALKIAKLSRLSSPIRRPKSRFLEALRKASDSLVDGAVVVVVGQTFP